MKQDSYHARLTSLIAVLLSICVGGCDTSEAPTVVPDVQEAVVDAEPEPPPAVPPKLQIDHPARGAWFGLDDEVVVAGVAAAVTGSLDSVTVLGEPALMSDSAFTYTPQYVEGINIIGVRVRTDDGERTVDGRSFFRGDVRLVGAAIPDAIRVHLGQEFLDDDDPELDDASGIVEALVQDPEVLGKLQDPVDTDFAVLTPLDLTVEGAAVDILPTDGELKLSLTLEDVHLAFHLDGKGGLKELLSGPGTLDATAVDVTLFMALEVVGGQVSAEVTYASVEITGFDLQQIKLDSIEEDYPSLADDLQDYVKEFVTESFQDIAKERVGGLLAGVLEGFAYETTFGDDPVINVALTLQSVTVAPHGMNLSMTGSVSANLGPGVPFGPAAGSLRTTSSAPEPYFSSSPVAFLIDDDLINQFLFATWFGGGLSKRAFTAAEMAEKGVDLTGLPEVFQPLSRLELDTLLPLTLHPRTLAADEMPFELSLGELNLRLITEEGRSFGMSINARTGFDLMLDPVSSVVTARMDTRPKAMVIKVGCYEAPIGIDPGSVASLIRLGFPPLLDQAAADFAYGVPGLPLDGLVSLPGLADKELGFADLLSDVTGPERNQWLLEGRPVLRPVSEADRTSE